MLIRYDSSFAHRDAVHDTDFYLLQSVTGDSLNRLVVCAADDSKIIGICGETKLDNEEGSWWTMIQVRLNNPLSLRQNYLLYLLGV